MSLALLFHYLMLNMFRMLIHPSSGACELFVELFHVLYCSGSKCVCVMVWFGWGGVVSLCRLKHRRSATLSFFLTWKCDSRKSRIFRSFSREAIIFLRLLNLMARRRDDVELTRAPER